MRNLLSAVPHAAQEAVVAIVRTIFAQPDHASALAHLKDLAEMLRPKFAAAADLLEDVAEDVLACMHFPREHWRPAALHQHSSSASTRRSNAAPGAGDLLQP